MKSANLQKNLQKRKNAYHFGSQAEILSINYFANLGYHFMSKRYKTPYGEVDLIMRSPEDYYVFIEVKARKKNESVFYSISERQKKRILSASLSFLQKENLQNVIMRFDAVFVMEKEGYFDSSYPPSLGWFFM
jgi:putative endonuclease